MKSASSSFKTVCFFLFLLTACGNIQPEKSSPTENPTLLPVTSAITQTVSPIATNTPFPPAPAPSPTAIIEMPTMIVTPNPTDLPGNYLMYTVFPNQDLWAVNPKKPIPFRVLDTSNLKNLWSPSHKFRLYAENKWLYKIPESALTAPTTSVDAFYNYSQFKSIVSMNWLTDDVLLFEDYQGKYPYGASDLYSLNITSGRVTKLIDASSFEMMGAIFSDEKKWLKIDTTDVVSILDENGNSDAFFPDFLILGPTILYFDPKRPFVDRIVKLDKYLFVAQERADPKSNFKLWIVSKHENPYMLFDPNGESIDQFSVSPDEKYIAITPDSMENNIYIFSTDTLQLLYKWFFPYKIGLAEFLWSPDSDEIAFYYSNDSHSGVQIMDIKTGKTKIIVKKDVAVLQDWKTVK